MQESSLAQAIAKTCLPPELWIMIFDKLDLSSAIAAMQVVSVTLQAFNLALAGLLHNRPFC